MLKIARSPRHELINLELPLLAVGLRHRVEDEAGRHGQAAAEHESHGEHRRGDAQHYARCDEGRNHGDAHDEAERHEDERNPAEEGEGLVFLEQARDGLEHLRAVAEGRQLRVAALGAVAVLDGHVDDAPALVDRVDGELGFDLEALREHRHGLDEGAVEGAVARHDVVEGEAVDGLDQPAHEVVSEAVEGPVVLLAVASVGQAVADRHVGLARGERRDEVAGRLGGVGVVAVDHDVVVGVDVAEHGAHDVALALARLAAHDGAVLGRDLRGVVLRVVVVDVDGRLGQLAPEVVDHLRDGHGLVIARYENRDAFAHQSLHGEIQFVHRTQAL